MLLLIAASLIAQDPEGFVETAEDRPQLQSRASWPNRIEAIEPLGAHLRRDIASRRATAIRFARRSEADARRRNYPFVPHVVSIDWQAQGVTPQLVSLSGDVSITQGGGHSTDSYDVLLWDHLRGRPAAIASMVDWPSMSARFCAAYPEALIEHNPPPEGDARWACPRVQALPLAPADTDDNGRFDTMRVLIAPASYFEAHGFSVNLPILPSDIARLPEAYRPAFEVPDERRDPTPQE